MTTESAQFRLLRIATSLPPGKAITLSNQLIRDASIGDLPGLDRLGGARESDIKDFIEKIQKNWGIDLTFNPYCDTWTMYKPNNDSTDTLEHSLTRQPYEKYC